MKKPEKIILFITDHQRYDTFSALGHPVIKTPNFDRLMSEGVTFTKAYSHCPLCVPSRANLWTGLPAHVTGVLANRNKIPLGTLCIPEFFTDKNWYTVSVGRLHFSPFNNPHGFQRNFLSEGAPFINEMHIENSEDPESITGDTKIKGRGIPNFKRDRYLMPAEYPRGKDDEDVTTWVTETAISHLKKTGSLPTFMNIGYIRPHPEFNAVEGWNDMYPPDSIPLPENRFEKEGLPKAIVKLQNRRQQNMVINDYVRDDILKQNLSVFYGDISHIDHNLGKLVEALKQNKMWDDTLLICTSDHGEMIGNHGLYLKSNFYEESSHVPLIMTWPNGLPAGIKVEEVVSLQDIFTTCMELLEHPFAQKYLPYRHANLVDMAYGMVPENNRVFIETQGGCEWGICNVGKQYKYSFYTYSDDSWEHSLFDLFEDPGENTNIAEKSPELVRKMRWEIVSYLEPDVDFSHFLCNKLMLLKKLACE